MNKISNFISFLIIAVVLLTGCYKKGLYEKLPGIEAVAVLDPQNTKNVVNSISVKNASGEKIPYYFLSFKTDTLDITTTSTVVDTLFVSLPPNTNMLDIRIIPQFLSTSMSPQSIVDTNKALSFTQLEDALKINGHSYTLIDEQGFTVTFKNGYVRKYIIMVEPLSFVPPRIYNLGSYTGGLDSVAYDDANQLITIYRSPFNISLNQILEYKVEPANATVDPQYASGTVFNFSSAPQQTIFMPISVPTADGGTKTQNYRIKLNLGFYKISEVLNKVGAHKDDVNFSTGGSTTYDGEMAIAVNENYVYVLRLNSFPANSNLTWANYKLGQVFAYSLKDPNAAPIALAMPPTQGVLGDSFPPVSDIIISGNKLIGTGFTQRPGGRRTGNISKSFFVSWDANNPQNYIIGDSVEMTLYNNIGAPVQPTMIKGNIEGNIDQNEGAYYYAFHTGAFYSNSTNNTFYPACKRIKLGIDANGAVRVASLGGGLDTTNYYFNANNIGASGLSGKLSFQHIPNSEGGGTIISNGGVTFYAKSILNNEVSTNSLTASNAIYFCGNGKIASVLGNTVADNEMNGMVYFKYGNINYMASLDWVRGASSKNNGISFFDIGSPVFNDKPSMSGNTPNGTYIQSKRVYKYSVINSGTTTPQNRGGIVQYRLANGSIRIAVLIPGVGFGVYDIK